MVLNAQVVANRCAIVDARNGGSIVAEPDQLWAANVYVATDDMHRFEDAETDHDRALRHRRRRRGGDPGEGARPEDPAPTAVGGCPARVIREGVTWRGEDAP